MRNIAEIIKDDRNGKQLSQTERQIATAYIQGKYDAVMELKIGKSSSTNKVLDKIRAEIDELYSYVEFDEDLKTSFNMVRLEEVQRVIDKYKVESEVEDGT